MNSYTYNNKTLHQIISQYLILCIQSKQCLNEYTGFNGRGDIVKTREEEILNYLTCFCKAC